MKRNLILILAVIILALVAYAVFVIAAIKIVVGAIILLITLPVLWYFWNKLKNKAEDTF